MSDKILGIEKKWLYIGLGIILAIAIFYALGGLGEVLQLLNENIWMPIALICLIWILLGILRRNVNIWNGPDGVELLKKAIVKCDYFIAAGITWQTLPKSKNELDFKHDQKHTQFHYNLRLNREDEIKTKVTIAYDPWKPGDWAPKVKEARAMTPVDLNIEAGHGSKPGHSEKDIMGEEPEEDEEE
ncbi:MAG: hypothetical protein WC483_06570 [Candidatus Paceibacterota bacterium]|jgi:hypothetical protein